MAFEVTERWTTTRTASAFALINAVGSVQTPNWLNHPRLEAWRKPVLIGFSATFHAGLLYLLVVNGLVPVDDMKRWRMSLDEARLTLLELSPPIKAPPLPDRKQEGSGSGESASAPNVAQALQQPPVMPSEWSIAKIRVASSAALVANEMAVTQGTFGATGSGMGQGSGAGFDPYAGAAPQRRPDNLGAVQTDEPSGLLDPRLDRTAFREFIQKLREQLGLSRGTILLSVTVTPDGRIREAQIEGGDANMQLKLFVRTAVTGERLFKNGAASSHKMPAISI